MDIDERMADAASRVLSAPMTGAQRAECEAIVGELDDSDATMATAVACAMALKALDGNASACNALLAMASKGGASKGGASKAPAPADGVLSLVMGERERVAAGG